MEGTQQVDCSSSVNVLSDNGFYGRIYHIILITHYFKFRQIFVS